MRIPKAVDLPPIWLAVFAGLAWLQGRYLALGLSLDFAVVRFLSGLLIGGGIILMLLAFAEFRRHRTTVIPHRHASSLIQSGIFSRTRNPIYLGDILILAGIILFLDSVLSLILVPVFAWFLERRFVIPEENRLRRDFKAEWARYERKVRRWI